MMQRADAAVEIAPVCQQDLPTLAAIAAVSFPDPWSESLFQQTWNSPFTEMLKAVTSDGDIAGYLVLTDACDIFNVDDIATAPVYRRCGIGSRLLTHAIGLHPDSEFQLEVREHNEAAIALYQRFGFQQVGFRKRYYRNPDEGAMLMTRTAQNTSPSGRDGTAGDGEG